MDTILEAAQTMDVGDVMLVASPFRGLEAASGCQFEWTLTAKREKDGVDAYSFSVHWHGVLVDRVGFAATPEGTVVFEQVGGA